MIPAFFPALHVTLPQSTVIDSHRDQSHPRYKKAGNPTLLINRLFRQFFYVVGWVKVIDSQGGKKKEKKEDVLNVVYFLNKYVLIFNNFLMFNIIFFNLIFI